jgi:hypothetical protein
MAGLYLPRGFDQSAGRHKRGYCTCRLVGACGLTIAAVDKINTHSFCPALLTPGELNVCDPLLAKPEPMVEEVPAVGSNQRAVTVPVNRLMFTTKLCALVPVGGL